MTKLVAVALSQPWQDQVCLQCNEFTVCESFTLAAAVNRRCFLPLIHLDTPQASPPLCANKADRGDSAAPNHWLVSPIIYCFNSVYPWVINRGYR